MATFTSIDLDLKENEANAYLANRKPVTLTWNDICVNVQTKKEKSIFSSFPCWKRHDDSNEKQSLIKNGIWL
jgi:hypothetical protein